MARKEGRDASLSLSRIVKRCRRNVGLSLFKTLTHNRHFHTLRVTHTHTHTHTHIHTLAQNKHCERYTVQCTVCTDKYAFVRTRFPVAPLFFSWQCSALHCCVRKRGGKKSRGSTSLLSRSL